MEDEKKNEKNENKVQSLYPQTIRVAEGRCEFSGCPTPHLIDLIHRTASRHPGSRDVLPRASKRDERRPQATRLYVDDFYAYRIQTIDKKSKSGKLAEARGRCEGMGLVYSPCPAFYRSTFIQLHSYCVILWNGSLYRNITRAAQISWPTVVQRWSIIG